jgi:diguanylate cyclase (GGDEF)-like protein
MGRVGLGLRPPGQWRLGRQGLTLLGCVLAATLATQLTGPADGVRYRIGLQSVAVVAVVLAGIGAWRHRRSLGRSGLLIFLALATTSVGGTGVTINDLWIHSDASPNWTDAFYLSAYIFFMAAAVSIIRNSQLTRNIAAVIDSAILTVGVGVLAYSFVIAEIASDPTVTTAARLVGMLYPLCDVLVVGMVTRLLFSSSGHRVPVLFLAGGMFCLLAGDLGFIVEVFAGTGSHYANWIDTLYLVSDFLVALSLWQRDTPRMVEVQPGQDERLGPLRIAVLSFGALLAPITLLIQNLEGDDDHVRGAAIGAIILFVLTLVRMTLLIRAVESQSAQLAVLARTDGLTGLANRRTFDFELGRAMRESLDQQAVTGEPSIVTVGLLDLDHFKRFNDTHGHSRGDQLLRECAAHWSDALTGLVPPVFMARYGGEEFVAIFPGQSCAEAVVILTRMMARTPMEQTFSAGVASWQPGEPALDLLNRADGRLYAAKSAGRQRVFGDPADAPTSAPSPTPVSSPTSTAPSPRPTPAPAERELS